MIEVKLLLLRRVALLVLCRQVHVLALFHCRQRRPHLTNALADFGKREVRVFARDLFALGLVEKVKRRPVALGPFDLGGARGRLFPRRRRAVAFVIATGSFLLFFLALAPIRHLLGPLFALLAPFIIVVAVATIHVLVIVFRDRALVFSHKVFVFVLVIIIRRSAVGIVASLVEHSHVWVVRVVDGLLLVLAGPAGPGRLLDVLDAHSRGLDPLEQGLKVVFYDVGKDLFVPIVQIKHNVKHPPAGAVAIDARKLDRRDLRMPDVRRRVDDEEEAFLQHKEVAELGFERAADGFSSRVALVFLGRLDDLFPAEVFEDAPDEVV